MPPARYAIAISLVLCVTGFLPSANSQVKDSRKTPLGTISGTVRIKGKAAAGVLVGVHPGTRSGPFEQTFKATTDQDGRYRVLDVPAGSYQVAPVAPAFILTPTPAGWAAEVVVVGDGENVEGIDFTLIRGGVISGRVTDADGQPVIEQRVWLTAADAPQNQRSSPVVGGATDDRGIYRIFGIAPGRYNVSTGQGEDSLFMTVIRGRPPYRQTFYPDAAEAAKAHVLEVAEGSEILNVDISLPRATQTFVAKGTVVDGETGKPVPNVRFGLQLIVGDRSSFAGGGASANSLGEFTVENLAPGRYGIYMLPQPSSDLRSDAISFEIVDQDVEGLVVKMVKGTSLDGIVALENPEDKIAMAKLLQMSLQVYVQSTERSPGFGQSAAINSDGSFHFRALQPGLANISLGAQDRSLLKGFAVARIERDGVVQQRGLNVKSGEDISGVRVVVSYGNATARGVVNVEGGLPEGGRVFVQVTKIGETRRPLQQSPPQVDARGHFLLEGVPSGLYEFRATLTVPGARPVSAKQQANLLDGTVTEVMIPISPKPDPPN